MRKLEDLDFTLALLSHRLQDMQEKVDSLGETAQRVGLKVELVSCFFRVGKINAVLVNLDILNILHVHYSAILLGKLSWGEVSHQ